MFSFSFLIMFSPIIPNSCGTPKKSFRVLWQQQMADLHPHWSFHVPRCVVRTQMKGQSRPLHLKQSKTVQVFISTLYSIKKQKGLDSPVYHNYMCSPKKFTTTDIFIYIFIIHSTYAVKYSNVPQMVRVTQFENYTCTSIFSPFLLNQEYKGTKNVQL